MKPFVMLCLVVVSLVAGTRPAESTEAPMNEVLAHDFSFPAIEGGTLSLAAFAGRPVLLVNTASFCGFTPQYEDLQALYDAHRDDGLVVIGVPSNDFGGQEPGGRAEIKEFCEVNYSINFPMTDKQRVAGPDAHPFYKWAREVLGPENAPGWNFHKYLIDPDGRLVAAYPSRIRPQSSEIERAIAAYLTD